MVDDIVPLAKDLISIQSVSGNIEKAVEIFELIKTQLPGYEPIPFVANSFPSLLYGNKGKNVREFKVILNAHLDVVPAAEQQFHPVEKNGRIYGRGAFDMKAAAAVKI